MEKKSTFKLSWLFAIVALFSMSFSVSAQNRLYIGNFSVKNYEPVKVGLMLDNADPVNALSAKLVTQGLEVLSMEKTNRADSQALDARNLTNGGNPSFMFYGPGESVFSGNSGVIAYITVKAKDGVLGTDAPVSITLTDIKISGIGGEKLVSGATSETSAETPESPFIVYPVEPSIQLNGNEPATITLNFDAVFKPYGWQSALALPKGMSIVDNSVEIKNATDSDNVKVRITSGDKTTTGQWTIQVANYAGGPALSVSDGLLMSFKVVATDEIPNSGSISISTEMLANVTTLYQADCIVNYTYTQPTTTTSVWVVGNGSGMTWDLPGKEYTGENGIVNFDLTGVSSFKVSTVEATEWDTFNANAYATGNTNFSNKVGNAGGETLPVEIWGENQELPWTGDYSITLNLNNMTMTAYTATPQPTTAPDVYIRGGMNNWLNGGAQDAWKFTNVNWDAATSTGEFTLNCSINAGVTFKIADMNWGSVNYGIGTNQPLNELINLNFGGGDISLAKDFDGTITFKITGTKSATVIFSNGGEVTYPEQFYVIGTLPGNAWNPTYGVLMTGNGEGVYTADEVVLEEDGGFTGFTIVNTLDSDWGIVNAFRFGPTTANAEAIIGTNTELGLNGNSWSITPGTYKMIFDYVNKTLDISVVSDEPTEPSVLYLAQPFNTIPAVDPQYIEETEPGVYEGVFKFKTGMSYIGFYTMEGDVITKYSKGGFGTFPADPAAYPLTETLVKDATSTWSWYIPSLPAGCQGRFNVTVNTNDLTITVDPIYEEAPAPDNLYLWGSTNGGVRAVNMANFKKDGNVYTLEYEVPACGIFDTSDSEGGSTIERGFSFFLCDNGTSFTAAGAKRYYGPKATSEEEPNPAVIDLSAENNTYTATATVSGAADTGGNFIALTPGLYDFTFNYETKEFKAVLIEEANQIQLNFVAEGNVAVPYKKVTVQKMFPELTDLTIENPEYLFSYMTSQGLNIVPVEGYTVTIEAENGEEPGTNFSLSPIDVEGQQAYNLGLYPQTNGYVFNVIISEAVAVNSYLGIAEGQAPTAPNMDYVLTSDNEGVTFTGTLTIQPGQSFNIWYPFNGAAAAEGDENEDNPAIPYMPVGPASEKEVEIYFTTADVIFNEPVTVTADGFWTLMNEEAVSIKFTFDMATRTLTAEAVSENLPEPTPNFDMVFTFAGVEDANTYVNMMGLDYTEYNVNKNPFTVSFEEANGVVLSAKEGYTIAVECTTPNAEEGVDYTIDGLATENGVAYTVSTTAEMPVLNFLVTVEEQSNEMIFYFGGIEDAYTQVDMFNLVTGTQCDVDSNPFTVNYETRGGVSLSAKEGYNLTVECTSIGAVSGVDYKIEGLSTEEGTQYTVNATGTMPTLEFMVTVEEQTNQMIFFFDGIEDAYTQVEMINLETGTECDVDSNPFTVTYETRGAVNLTAKEGYVLTVECTTIGATPEKDYVINGVVTEEGTQYTVGATGLMPTLEFMVMVEEAPVMFETTFSFDMPKYFDVDGNELNVITLNENEESLNDQILKDKLTVQYGEDGLGLLFSVNDPFKILTYEGEFTEGVDAGGYYSTSIDLNEADNEEEYVLAVYRIGDVNHDGRLNVLDIQILIDWIGNDYTFADLDALQAVEANIDGDDELNIVDLTALISMIRENNTTYRQVNAMITDGDNTISFGLVNVENGTRTYALYLDNVTAFRGAQLDILTSGNATVSEVMGTTRTQNHDIHVFNHGLDHSRVILVSMDNASFSSDRGILLLINVEGEGDLALDNVIFADTNNIGHKLMPSTTTGIDNVFVGDNGMEMIFDASGRRYNRVQQGVNIIRHTDGSVSKELRK